MTEHEPEYLVVHGVQQPARQEVEEAREEHRLNVRDQLRLAHEAVEAGRLLKALR